MQNPVLSSDVDVVDKIIMGILDDDDDADTLVIDIGNIDGFFDDIDGGGNSSSNKDNKAGLKNELSAKKATEVRTVRFIDILPYTCSPVDLRQDLKVTLSNIAIITYMVLIILGHN